MPDLDGMGVLARMREAGLEHSGDRADRAWRHRERGVAMRAGAADFVVKPAAPSACRSRLSNALATEALAGELQRLKRKQRRHAALSPT